MIHLGKEMSLPQVLSLPEFHFISSRVCSRYPLAWPFCALLLCVADAVELTDMFGEIHSPNFPDSYPSDSEMTWNISVPDGFKIKLYFMHFDLESSYLCEYDYVKVSCDISGQKVG